MATQFVKLTPPELDYGESYLLQSQAGIIDVLKRMENFKELRKTELKLKLAFKKSVSEASMMADELESLLPKIKIKKEEVEKEEQMIRSLEIHKDIFEKERKATALDEELREIRKKLSRLTS